MDKFLHWLQERLNKHLNIIQCSIHNQHSAAHGGDIFISYTRCGEGGNFTLSLAEFSFQ